MSQQTSQKRVRFHRTLISLIGGVFSVSVLCFVAAGSSTFYPQKTYAATNNTVNFQARLESVGGNIAADGYYNLQFKLYSVSTGGTALWSESYYDSNGAAAGNDSRVQVINGYVSVNLGSQTAFPGTINWDQDMYLTMNVGGTSQTATPTYDGEMNPRLRLTGVPYAFRAGQLAQYNSGTGFTSTLSIMAPTGGNQIFQIADQGAAGTYTLLTSAAASGNFIQNQNAAQQTASNYWISGTGRADTGLQTPLLDTASAGALNIGTTNATQINLNQNTNVTGNLSIARNTNADLVLSIANSFSGKASYITATANSNFAALQLNGTGQNWNAGQLGNTSFSVQDATGSKTPFSIAAGSPTGSVAISTNGVNIGSSLNVGSATAGAAGRLFSDGFESGNLKLWGGVTAGTVTADTTQVKNGKYAAKIVQAGAGSRVTTPIASSATVAIHGQFYATGNPSTSNAILAGAYNLTDATGLVGISRSSAGQLCVYLSFTGTSNCSASSFANNAWNDLELVVTSSTTTGGSYALYLNGVSILSASGVRTNTSIANFDSLQVGSGSAITQTFWADAVSADIVQTGSPANLNVADSLHVSGTSSFGNNILVQSASDSAVAFQVQNAAGGAIFSIDAANKDVVLGKTGVVNSGLYFSNAVNANLVGLRVADGTAGYALTLPSTAPAVNQCLSTLR